MKRTPLAIALACATAAVPMTASAQALYEQGNVYLGAGISRNDLSGWDDATGYQIFAGFEPHMPVGPVNLGVELGYMDSGDFSRSGVADATLDGVWISGVGRFPITPQFNALARLGYDFGDDDGLLYGAGLGFNVNVALEVRGEYVVRDEMDSLQANFVINF